MCVKEESLKIRFAWLDQHIKLAQREPNKKLKYILFFHTDTDRLRKETKDILMYVGG